MSVRKLVSFAYWRLILFFNKLSSDGLSEFKAAVVIGSTTMVGIVALLGLAAALTGHQLPKLNTPLKILGVLVAILIASSMYSLKSGWTKYEAEFKGYSKNAVLIGSLLTLAAVLFVFAAFACVVVQLRGGDG